MEREVAQAREKPGMEDWMSNAEGFVLAYSGHLEEAREDVTPVSGSRSEAERRETEAFYETDAALREALFGNASTARQRAMAALGLSNSRDVEYGVAFALAVSGDSSRSQTLTDDISRRFPEDTKVRFTFTPTLRALLALGHNEPLKAVELLQTAIPYENGIVSSGGSEQLLGAGNLYSVYVRGEAYLAAHQGREAAIEFQKILDHRGDRGQRPYRRTGASATWARLRTHSRHGQGPHSLQRFSHPLERRGPRHPHSERSQGGIRKAAIAETSLLWKPD